MGWLIALTAATFVGLLLFAAVTALMDMQQWVRWLVVSAVLSAECLLLTAAELVGFADYRWANVIRLVSWQGSLPMQLFIGLGTVLAIHTLLWPVRALLGWQVQWAGEESAQRERLLTLWHLVAWVVLIAFLLVAAGSSMNAGMLTIMVLLGEFAALLAGLPVLILATRRKRLPFWIPGVLAGLIGLSWAESELTFLFTKVTGSGTGIPLPYVAIWNGAVAGTVLLAIFLLRWAGLEFHLPISRREAALRAATDEMPVNSLARREFRFSLRSLFILTTLLCLGPGAYVAWEREQCRRGREIIARIVTLGGKVSGNRQPRSAWLQTVIGDDMFRCAQGISLDKSSVKDADLAQLSGLPYLENLNLMNTHLTDDGLASLSDLKNLRILFLIGTKVTDDGLAHVSGLSKLNMLQLTGTNVTDNGLVHLTPLANLESLGLDGTAVSDAGLHHLPANLKTLGLSYTKVGDPGLSDLPADLKWLVLLSTKVTDEGMPAVSRLTKLENLNLSGDPISDAGLKHLESLQELRHLVLDNTQVTDAGLISLSRLPNLEYLYLDNLAITDAGLAQLEGLPNLKILVVTKTQVTAAGAAKLNKKLPALKIHR